MPVAWMQDPTLQIALRSILYLEINVSQAPIPPVLEYLHRLETQYGDGLLRVFRAAAPSLLELGLQIFPELRRAHWPYAAGQFGADVWREQSFQYLSFQKIVENVRFENLTRLKLEKIVAEPRGLEIFLSPSKDKLTSLKLRDIRLLSGDEGGSRPWEQIFGFLLDSVPRLDYVLLYQLLYTHGGVSFVERPPRPSAAMVNTNDHAGPQTLVETRDAGHFAYVRTFWELVRVGSSAAREILVRRITA